MTKIEEIAARRDVFMIECDSIVLVVAGDTHWFSDAEDVLWADKEATEALDEDPQDVFFCECAAILRPHLSGKHSARVAALLDILREGHADVYAKLGGSRERIVATTI